MRSFISFIGRLIEVFGLLIFLFPVFLLLFGMCLYFFGVDVRLGSFVMPYFELNPLTVIEGHSFISRSANWYLFGSFVYVLGCLISFLFSSKGSDLSSLPDVDKA